MLRKFWGIVPITTQDAKTIYEADKASLLYLTDRDSNGPSLHEKEEVEKFLLAVVARFKAFKKRVPSNSCGDKRPQRASASKAKSSVLSQLSGLENVVFNDFIDNELDSQDVSELDALSFA